MITISINKLALLFKIIHLMVSSNINPFIASILASTVISAIITLIGNHISKNWEFKFSYKKYILDQRIKAYENCKKVINELMVFYEIDMPGAKKKKAKIHGAFYVDNGNKLDTYTASPTYLTCLKVADIFSESKGWLSNEMVNALNLINEELLKSYNLQLNQKDLKANFIENQGVALFKEFHIKILKAHDIFFHDIKQLDNIRKFKKNKRNYDTV